jgi:Ran GTPase-activating protein (RanGAP) involved in mRNA processing and transport
MRVKKTKGMLEKDEIAQRDESGNLISVSYRYKNPIFSIFEDDLFAELYNARCHDTGEILAEDGAQMFREEVLKRNDQHAELINLHGMRLGINSIISLANSLICRHLVRLNLADNAISDYGMHAIKNIMESTNIQELVLASNMISGEGLETLVDSIADHPTFRLLDLGLFEGSMRKNSLGRQGATCLAAILIKNSALQELMLEDNDLGIGGGECFGLALTQNDNLKQLKVAENELRTEGATFILKNAYNLEMLNLSKNYINSDVGPTLESLLRRTRKLTKLILEYNELMPRGAEQISRGLRNNATLLTLNLKGNILGDEGVFHIVSALQQNRTLQHLNLGLNEIGPMGASALAQVIQQSSLKSLNLSKNFLGDEAVIVLSNVLGNQDYECNLAKIDFSSCRVGDRGVEYFFSAVITNKHLQSVSFKDNFISEQLEPIVCEYLEANYTLCKVGLTGNRLSHSCILKVKKLCERNKRDQENFLPNSLKTEQNRLQFEHRKLAVAQDKLNQQIDAVKKVKALKRDIMDEMEKVRATEKARRDFEKNKMLEEQAMIEEKREAIEACKRQIEEMKMKVSKEVGELREEYEAKAKRKKELEQERRKIMEENLDIESEFPERMREVKEQLDLVENQTYQLQDEQKQVNQELMSIKREVAEAKEQKKRDAAAKA